MGWKVGDTQQSCNVSSPKHGPIPWGCSSSLLGARFGAFMAQGSVGLTPCQEWIRGLLVKA